jgi:hypothetical protein
MTTERQLLANRKNAQKSTGPRSVQGKEKVSRNRITHGILSNKLLLEGENPDEYQSLLDDLQAQMRPSGALELSLVEKIAVILWRQRRLAGAEAATIELETHPSRIAREIESSLGLSGSGSEKIEPKDFEPPDQGEIEHLEWCRAVIAEYDAADELNPENLSKVAPLIYAQLVEDAETEEKTLAEHFADMSLDEYVGRLVDWCHEEIEELEEKMERYPVVAALSEKAKKKLCVPWQTLDVLTKYQTTLDDQLYKAMKALKETQEWRIKSIDTTDPPDAAVPAGAV